MFGVFCLFLLCFFCKILRTFETLCRHSCCGNLGKETFRTEICLTQWLSHPFGTVFLVFWFLWDTVQGRSHFVGLSCWGFVEIYKGSSAICLHSGGECSDRYIISLSSHLRTPFSPSLISRMVSVDIKHHVYLLAVWIQIWPSVDAGIVWLSTIYFLHQIMVSFFFKFFFCMMYIYSIFHSCLGGGCALECECVCVWVCVCVCVCVCVWACFSVCVPHTHTHTHTHIYTL